MAETHIVQKGETFESIAKKYGVSLNELKEANPKTKQCFAGLKLVIPETVGLATPVIEEGIIEEDSFDIEDDDENYPESQDIVTSDNIASNFDSNPLMDRLFTDENFLEEYLEFSERKLKETASLKPREFEGILLYSGYVSMSNLMKWLSFGQGYNGEYLSEVTIKGNKLHIRNKSMHQHLIIDENGNFTLYCDVSKKGLRGNKNMLDQYYGGIEYTNKDNEDFKVSRNVLGKPVEYNGDICKVEQGKMTDSNGFESEFEYWYAKDFILPENYKYVFPGFRSPGLMKKGIQHSSSKLPLVGSVNSVAAFELVASTEYPVSDSEFQIPADIEIEEFTKNSQMIKFLRGNSKALKKQKLYPKTKKAKDVKLAITEKWDFAEDWMKKDSGFEAWLNTGESLLNGIVSVCDFIEKIEKIYNPVEPMVFEDAYMGEMTNGGSGKMLDIDYLIADNLKTIEKTKHLPEKQQWKDEYIQNANQVLSKLRQLKSQGITEISIEEYQSFSAGYVSRVDQRIANFRGMRAINNDRYSRLIKNQAQSNYNYMESTLSNWNTSNLYNREYDYTKVQDMQRNMRDIRNRYGGKKSNWEDWKGYKHTQW